MRVSGAVGALVAALSILAGTPQAPADTKAPVAASALGRWYRSLPGWGCFSAPFPLAYQTSLTIGPEVRTLLGGPHAATSAFTGAALDDDLTRIGAIDDPNHHSALFWEHGQDRGSYLLIAGAGAPPVPVNETNLSKLAMGGKVHLGDSLERARSIFGKATAFRLTSLSSCAFPHAAAYAAATVYGPPHHPRIPAAAAMCREIGPDIARGQTLGTIVFRANRVVVLIWNYEECSI